MGLTLYEFLALRPAFDSTDRLSTIQRITNEDPPRLQSINRRIPRELETIVMKAIDKQPRSRYASAAELADDLHNFIHDLPIKARRHSLLGRLARWSRRNRGVAAALAFALASLILLAVVSSYSALKQSTLRQNAEAAREQSEIRGRQLAARGEQLEAQKKEQQKQALVLKDQADTLQRNLYYAQMNLASAAASRAGGAETVRARLRSTHPDQLGKDLRGWEWYYLYSLVNQEKYCSEAQPHWTWEVSYSPDGSKLVNVINGGGFQIRDALTGAVLRSKMTGSCRSAQWSPDGNRIATGDFAGDIYIWDAETLELKKSILDDRDREIVVRWSRDSSRLASYARYHSDVTIWDAAEGTSLLSIHKNEDGQCDAIAWSPTDNLLAIASYPKVLVYREDSQEPMVTLVSEGDHDSTNGLSWSTDGNRIAVTHPLRVWDWKTQERLHAKVVSNHPVAYRPGHEQVLIQDEKGIKLLDVATQRVIRRFFGQTAIESFCWSPDGHHFASSGLDHTVRIWSIDSNAPFMETTADGNNDSLAWGGDDKYLIADSNKNYLNIWNSANADFVERPFSAEVEGYRLWAIAVNRQNSQLAFGGQSRYVSVWDPSTDQVQQYHGEVGETYALDWSSDGRLAAICWPPYFDQSTDTAFPKTANNLVIWDLDGNIVGGPKPTHAGFGTGLSWHPDGTQIATAARDNFIRIWDTSTMALIREIQMPAEHVFFERAEVRFSPDGKLLATANRNAILIWDAESGALLGKLNEIREDFTAVDWSPNGHLLAAGSGASTTVWDANNFRLTIKFPTGAGQVKWAADGRRLGVCYGETMRIFDASRGYELEGSEPPSALANNEDNAAKPNPPDTPAKSSAERSEFAEFLTDDECMWSEPVRLPNTVNSQHNEYEPFITHDGLQLYFNSDRPGGLGGFDLYVCSRDSLEDEWGTAVNLGESVNSPADDEGAHVTPDGLSMYLNSNRTGNMKLYVCQRKSTQDTWGTPQQLPSPINSIGNDAEPTLSPDGLTLMFVSTRAQKFELFVAKRTSLDDPWSAPKKPAWLNTANWQGAPHIVDDASGSTVIMHSAEGLKVASGQNAKGSFIICEPLAGTEELGGPYAPCLWIDGRTLYYRRSNPETKTFDIWVSERVKKSE